MIFRLEFVYGAELEVVLAREKEFVAVARPALRDADFHAHLIWPRVDNGAVALIVEGGEEPEPLVEAFGRHSQEAGLPRPEEVRLDEFGSPPGEFEALPAEERSVAIVEMAVPQPGGTCSRCDAILPPHESWCTWDIGGPGERADSGGDGGRDQGSDELAGTKEWEFVSAVATEEEPAETEREPVVYSTTGR